MVFLAEKLGEYISDLKYKDIPVNVRKHAKFCLLDALGVALASADKKWCRAVHDYVVHQGGTAEATVWYHGDRVPDTNAALANAMFVHSMDFNDDLAGILRRLSEQHYQVSKEKPEQDVDYRKEQERPP